MTDHSTATHQKTIWRQHPLIMLLLTLLFCTLFVALGLWQLQRAKQAQQQQQLMTQKRSPLSLAELSSQPQQDGLPLAARGHFDNAHALLLDNQIWQGVAGYALIQPFITDDGQALLVNRGWLARGAERTQLPTITPIIGQRDIRGLTHRPTRNRFLPAQNKAAPANWPAPVASIDPQLIGQWLNMPMLPVVLRLDSSIQLQQPPLPRHWQAPHRMTPARHLAYALQWFLFAAITLGIYLTSLWRQRRSLPAQDTHP